MRALFEPRPLTFSEEDRRLLVEATSRPLTLSDEDRAMLSDLIRDLPQRASASRPGSEGRSHWAAVAAVATAVAAVAAIATLGFVAWQTRIGASASKATQKAVEASVWAAATDATMNFDKALLEHDEDGSLYPYFNERASFADLPPADQSTRRRFEYMAYMQLDLLDGYWGLADFLPPTFIDKDSVGRWMRSTFANSPELCRHLERVQDIYADGFVIRAADACGAASVPFTVHRMFEPTDYWAKCEDDDPRTDQNCVAP
jgi:hypothetical protein